ncbi:type V CRISPR-associated protein Cas12a/Cpf1 [Candidatus Haliotispira prima]|uniref:Type V CRISPR-associated protein Cas12a/Cpf1 n=1 Tax=Candidatus Haliotispira prima TaxID=3034016 RepID=A0ABY8MDZ0_9SPIO|nr:type V CRISPR-associated protein Cas12a/Cpf1 [Candidatus Haliotispira prima]
MSSLFESFTNQYPIQKTLRWSLRPIGKTFENIKRNGLLSEDEERAEKYKQAKKIIDEYHKDFINNSLSQLAIPLEDLEEFKEAYQSVQKDNKDDSSKKELQKQQKKLRKLVEACFSDSKLFKRLFDKELIKEDLPNWLEKLEEKSIVLERLQKQGIEEPTKIIQDFNKWTTYFEGFHKNRKNVYTAEEHSTGIAYRLIHDNLPKFIDNLNNFQKAKELGVDFSEVEANFEIELNQVFNLGYFNRCLTQAGIDHYQLIRGGKSIAANRDQKRGVNQSINLHAQQLSREKAKAGDEDRKEITNKIKKVRSCQLSELYKQILSDRSSASFLFEEIESDSQLAKNILQTFSLNKKEQLIGQQEIQDETSVETKPFNLTEKLTEALSHLKEADCDKVYLKNSAALTAISKQIFGDWGLIKRALEYYAEHKLFPAKKETKKILDKREGWLKNTPYFSFNEIETALWCYFAQYKTEEPDSKDKEIDQKNADSPNTEQEERTSLKVQKEIAMNQPLIGYFTTGAESAFTTLLQAIKTHFSEAGELLQEYQDNETEKTNLRGEKEKVLQVKEYLDALMGLFHFVKPLYINFANKTEEKKAEALEKDNSFYAGFEECYAVLEQIIPLYNQTRNYLTKKPFNTEKYKLNFENPTLVKGWDKNREVANSCILFLKDHRYFLGVMDKKHNKVFEKNLLPGDGSNSYQKVDYKLLPGPSKMLPKVFFNDKNIGFYNPSEEIIRIRNRSSHTKGGTPQKGYNKIDFNIDDMRKMVDFFKESIAKHPEWRDFGFQFSATETYQDISAFYREVEHQGYKLTFKNVSEDYINQLVEEGKLYFFEIYSKDFSPNSKGRSNLQTLYWKALFDKDNLADVVYKLNGKAELFYRRASITYSDKIWQQGHHANDSAKKQDYPIIKDRRYAKDTFLFHVPITLGFKAEGINRFNDKVNGVLKNHPQVHILSIDRGERHLAYYTLIDQQGKIIKQASFNEINKKDYHKLLDEKEKAREEARESWGTIQRIKDLKAGYLSLVVHEIVKLMITHNAIVVFEDLNFGFKRGRFKIEKQIYQKLEKMLIDKLNYLVLKDKKAGEPGHVMKGLQLTDEFTSFKKLGKQTGCIFYVPAYHTSKICPTTGFVNVLYPRYETTEKAKSYFEKFNEIRYNGKYFEFDCTLSQFTTKAEGSTDHWVICAHGTRLENQRMKDTNSWKTEEIDLTKEFIRLFEGSGIDYRQGDLRSRIAEQSNSTFFKALMRLLRLTLQMRNSRTGTDEDWMVSPVKDANGEFFDSRKAGDNLPKDADANGAYHIGLKGLLMLKKLNSAKADLKITNKDWYQFAQDKKKIRGGLSHE